MEMQKIVKEWWFIIVFVMGIAVTWGTTKAELSEVKAQVSDLELQANLQDTEFDELKNSLIRIETSVEFIKENI